MFFLLLYFFCDGSSFRALPATGIDRHQDDIGVRHHEHRESLETIVCVTGQHRQMLDQVLNTFNVVTDYDLSIMKQGQTLFDITTGILEKIKAVLEKVT